MIQSNQYLAFNPKKPSRNDKHQRQGIQMKFRAQQYNQTNQDQPRITPSGHLYREELFERRLEPPPPPPKDLPYSLSDSNLSSRRGMSESDLKKEEILQRVKKLQNMVLPLVDREGDEEDRNEIGWQSKIERKILRIEGALDNARKEWEIQMEKRLIQLDEQLEERYLQLRAQIR